MIAIPAETETREAYNFDLADVLAALGINPAGVVSMSVSEYHAPSGSLPTVTVRITRDHRGV